MIPGTVYFTDLAVDAEVILRPRLNRSYIPLDWVVREVEVPIRDSFGLAIWRVNDWLEKHFEGRWATVSLQRAHGLTLLVAFELQQDAALFVLMNGAVEMIKATRATN